MGAHVAVDFADLACFDGWWFPKAERDLPAAMRQTNVRIDGRLTWQVHKYLWSRDLLPHSRRRVALDIGAHVGLWSYWMARDFTQVHAFEPADVHRRCFTWNTHDAANVDMHATALGAQPGMALLAADPGHSGGTHVTSDVRTSTESAPLRTLDSFGFEDVDYVKIDVEGFETDVIQGGEATFRRCKPVVIVEAPNNDQAPSLRYGKPGTSAVALLQTFGARVHVAIGHDIVLRWP